MRWLNVKDLFFSIISVIFCESMSIIFETIKSISDFDRVFSVISMIKESSFFLIDLYGYLWVIRKNHLILGVEVFFLKY